METNVKSTDAPIFLVGATATGKSALGMELARSIGGAILAMDAMQVYRGADIGTSKPTAAEQTVVLHGGLDLVEFGTGFDVAQYLKHAARFLEEQREAGRRVIVVGGTGLYFRALTRGLCEAPQGTEALRAELNALSTKELQERLKRVDPGMVEKIDASNPRRLVRAIEVMEATGKSLRVWQEETPEPLVKDFVAYWICRGKGELERRIEKRVEAMFEQGWVEEVRELVGRHGVEAVRAFAGIGYREIAELIGEADPISQLTKLSNEEGGEGAVVRSATATEDRGARQVKSDILVATRQYAKRQLTWFAREPKLQKVMVTGSQSFPEVLRTAAKPSPL